MIKLDWTSIAVDGIQDYDIYETNQKLNISNFTPKSKESGYLTTVSETTYEIEKSNRKYYTIGLELNGIYQLGLSTNSNDMYIESNILILKFEKDRVYNALTNKNSDVVNMLIQPNTVDAMNCDRFLGVYKSSISYPLNDSLGTNDFTTDVWHFSSPSNSDSYGRIIEIGNSGNIGSIHICRDKNLIDNVSSTFLIEIYTNFPNEYMYTQKTTVDSYENYTWHHFCIQRKDGIFYLHINGKLQCTIDNIPSFSLTGKSFNVGHNGNSGERESGGYNYARLTKGCIFGINNFNVKDFNYKTTTNETIINLYAKLNNSTSFTYDAVSDTTTVFQNTFMGFNSPMNDFSYTSYPSNVNLNTANSCISGTMPTLYTSDFTIDLWVTICTYVNDTINRNFLSISSKLNIAYTPKLEIYIEKYVSSSYSAISKKVFYGVLGSMMQITLMRKNNTLYLYINGKKLDATVENFTDTLDQNTWSVGSLNYEKRYNTFGSFHGFRVTNVARYNENGDFKPSTKYIIE